MRNLLIAVLALLPLVSSAQTPDELASQVIIRRTVHGVPLITGENLRAGTFGLA